MRRGTWILAVAGALAVQAGGAGAAEPGAPIRYGQGNGIPTRYTRPGTPSATPTQPAAGPSKNYYEELFGDVQKLNAGPAPTAAASTPSAAATGGQRPASAPPVRALPPDDFSQAAKPAEAAKTTEAAKTENAIFHATYDNKSAGDSNYIQPVRATAEGPAPATVGSPANAVGKQPQISVEWVKKTDMNIGQECEIELVARNVGTGLASQVKLEATFPSSIRLTSVEPKPQTSADKLQWTFDALPAGSEKRIAIKMIPSRRGDLGTSAKVTFESQTAHVFKIEEPLLKIAIKGPKEVMLGDPASQMITISNPGTGVAHNVKLEALLTDGLEHPRGERLAIEIGSINPGDSQTVRIGLSAAKGGMQTLQVAASSSCDASAAAVEKISIIAPSLGIETTGPGLRYVGRSASYTIGVVNDGTVANNNVRVSHRVPEGFQFVSADRGGKYEPSQRTIHWFLGRMDAGQRSQVVCELTATTPGDFRHEVSVVSDAGVRAEHVLPAVVKGAASLSTEIVDLNDPVEVGAETAWEVRVKNEGSKAASNIAVVCEIPEHVQLISAKGPTQAIADAKTVVFKGLPELAPGQQAIFRVHVKGQAEGTHRLRARVTSSALDEPLMMEEATKFYLDTVKP